ncbi:hypothetical protein TNCV_163451 [Trichonephila clavipes]|nr:hypothetical protein TNCV_163451 [Trichonephila clavipes]
MKKEKRKTYRCGQRTVRLSVVACSQKQSSLRAQAQQIQTKTLGLLREENAEHGGARAGVTMNTSPKLIC